MTWQRNPDLASIRNVTEAVVRGATDDAPPDLAAWSDERLMQAVTARQEAAFAVLYDRYTEVVYSAAYRVLGDSQLAEDTTQDIFVRLWRNPASFVAERGRFITWLMSVARNRAVDELRSRGRRRRREGVPGSLPEDNLLESLPAETDDPLTSAQTHERQALVRAALSGLPREQRLALELSYFSGLTQQQIAEVLNEPLGTVKTRIRLGMMKLRRALDGQVSPMREHLAQEQADEYAVGALDPEEAVRLALHAESCYSCGRLVAESERVAAALLFSIERVPPPSRLKGRVFREAGLSSPGRIVRIARLAGAGAGVAAVIVALASFVGLLSLRGELDDVQTRNDLLQSRSTMRSHRK